MYEWTLVFARDCALAVWLGGLIVIDFVETPARFRVPAINRNQVVAVGQEVFAAFNRMETVVGALLLALSALLVSGHPTISNRSRLVVTIVVAMWFVALFQYFWA